MKWKKYYQIARIGFREATAYRLNAVMSLATSVFYLILAYYIWSAIASAGTLSSSLTAVLSYIVIGQITSNSIFVNAEDPIGERVRKGTIVNELKRPISLRTQIYFYLFGQSLFNFLAKGVPVAIIGAFFLNLGIPTGINLPAFMLSLFLGLNLVFSFSFLTAMLIFWTKVAWSIRMMRNLIQRLFSGVLFPLYLLPDQLKPIFNITPFPSMVDAPISIFRMETTGAQLLPLFAEQIVWTLIILLFGELIWRKAQNKLTVQGG